MPNNLQVEIRKFIKKIGILKETIHDPKLDFGFRFVYPGDKGRTILIIKPKKKDFLEIQTPTSISPEHQEKLTEEKAKELFGVIAKTLILKEVHHNLDFQNKRYMLVVKHYVQDDTVDFNKINEIVRKLFFTDIYIIGIIQEFISGKFDSKDYGSNLRMYS